MPLSGPQQSFFFFKFPGPLPIFLTFFASKRERSSLRAPVFFCKFLYGLSPAFHNIFRLQKSRREPRRKNSSSPFAAVFLLFLFLPPFRGIGPTSGMRAIGSQGGGSFSFYTSNLFPRFSAIIALSSRVLGNALL